MAYPNYTDTNLNPLVLNYVPDPETFDQMTTDNQINDNEVYLVQEEEEKEIFYATYNETTYEEVVEAYESGKDIIVIYSYDYGDSSGDYNVERRGNLINVAQSSNMSSFDFTWMSWENDSYLFIQLTSSDGWGYWRDDYLSYVYTNDIADYAVTTDKIAQGAVASYKIADNAVTTGKIADKNRLIWYGEADYEDTQYANHGIYYVTIDGITQLQDGLTLQILFKDAGTSGSGYSLKLNDFPVYPIRLYGGSSSAINVREWAAFSILTLVYRSTSWIIVDGAHASTTTYGKTKLNSAVNSTSITEAATPSAVKQAYDLADSKAPISHASSTTTYGVGTESNYGHLKLSNSTTSTSGTSEGIAATPAAVKAVKDSIPTSTSDLTNDSGFITANDVPVASTTNPLMDGTASYGSGTTWARADHVHPSDTSKVSKSGDTMTGTLAFNGSGYGITFDYNDNASTTIRANGYQGTAENNTPILRFTSKKANTSGSSNYNVILSGIANPTTNYEAANKQYVDNKISSAIGNVNSFEYEVVSTLPTTSIQDHTIYLVAKTGETNDVYDEYMYINNSWEHIGSTEIDLSGYVPTTRTINNKALSSDITLNASDVGALPDNTVIPAQIAKIWTGTCSTASGTNAKIVTLDDSTGFSLVDGVKIAILFNYLHTGNSTNTTLNVNNTGAKQIILSNTGSAGSYRSGSFNWGNYDIVLFSYHASLDEWVFCGSYVLQQTAYNLASNAVPKTTTVNGKALSSNITLTASDVSALPSDTTYVSSVNGNSGAVTVTDEKVKATPLNGLNASKGLLFSSNTGADETTNTIYTSNKLMWNDYGTGPALYFYNGDRSKNGVLTYTSLRLAQSSSSYYGHLSLNTLTTNRNYYLPDATGTIALTSDIPTKLTDLTNDGNFVTDANYVHTDNNFTTTLKNKLDGIADGATVDDHKWNDVTLDKTGGAGGTAWFVPVLSSRTATTAYFFQTGTTPSSQKIAVFDSSSQLHSTTPTADDNSNAVATTEYVQRALANLLGPMKFMGTLGVNGTVTSLSAAASENLGHTYKVISAGTYQSVSAQVGDLMISTGTAWVNIPSGDEERVEVVRLS